MGTTIKELSKRVRALPRTISDAETPEIQPTPPMPLESKEAYEFLLEHSTDIVLVLNKRRKITYVNKRAPLSFGYPMEEIIGASITHFLTKDSMKRARLVLAQAFLGRPQPEFELQAKTKSGEIRSISVAESSVPLYENGRMSGIMISASDITEQKRNQAALEESERRFRDLWDEAPIAYHTADTKGIITNVNQTEARMFGYSKEELVGKPIFDLILPEQRAGALSRFQKKVAGKSLPRSEDRIFVKKDGSRIHAAVNDTLERGARGKITGIRSTLVDITPLHESKEALQKSEEHFRHLVEKSGIAILIDDEDGNLKYFNDRYAAIFGYSVEEMKTLKSWSTVHPDDVERVISYHRRRLQGLDVPSRYEFRAVRKDGSEIHLEVDVTALREGERTVVTRSYMWDITERKRTLVKQRESENRFRSIVEHSHDGILILDNAFQITYANGQSSRISGFAREELIGQDFRRFIDDEGRKLTSDFYLCLQKKVAVPPQFEFSIVRKDGQKRRMEISASAVSDALGKVEIIAQMRDITERKQAQMALQDSEEKYHTVVERSNDGIAVIQDGVIKYSNLRLAQMWGGDAEHIAGKPFQTYVHPDDAARLSDMYQRRMAGDAAPAIYEAALLRVDGRKVYTELSGGIIDYLGKPADLLMVRDITERKRVELELKNTLGRLHKIIGATVQAIASAVESRDPYTAGHQKRVADLARTIATEMGLPRDTIEGLRTAGAIHDLGKLSIPAEILSKPSKLSDIEFALIKTHPQGGFEILKDISFPWPVARIVLEHHERMDGSGYPRGLKGEEILVESRILGVADVVEAIASHRPYRPAKGVEAALQEIAANSGTLYDPEVVGACLRVFEKGYQFAGPDGKPVEVP